MTSMTTADLVKAVIAKRVNRLMIADPLLRLDAGVEAVHGARVATRRLRSDLRTFRPLLDRPQTDPLRDELRWFGTQLGAVRDADVLDQLLRGQLASLDERDASGGALLLATLAKERAQAHTTLVEAMKSDRYAALIDGLTAVAEAPPVVSAAAGGPARTVMPRLVRRQWRRLRCSVAALEPEPADAALHEVRKRSKQVRYAAEAAEKVAGRPAKKFAKAMKRIQDHLGQHQDAVVAGAWLDRTALHRDDKPLVLTAGKLAGLSAARRDQLHDEWPDEWRRAKRKRLRHWL